MSSPAKHARRIIATAREELAPLGASAEIGYGHGGHPHLIITLGNQSRRLAFANTPRNAEHSIRTTRRLVRKVVQGLEARQ